MLGISISMQGSFYVFKFHHIPMLRMRASNKASMIIKYFGFFLVVSSITSSICMSFQGCNCAFFLIVSLEDNTYFSEGCSSSSSLSELISSSS